MINESTDISMTQMLYIEVHSYDRSFREVVRRFWEHRKIFNDNNIGASKVSATREHLLKCVKESFQHFSVIFDDIIGFGCDGCNIMMGENNSVCTNLKKLKSSQLRY